MALTNQVQTQATEETEMKKLNVVVWKMVRMDYQSTLQSSPKKRLMRRTVDQRRKWLL